jgi:outer membrane protein OmpA-like peptidoglycan-associated protein
LGKQVGTTDANGDFKVDSISAGMQLVEISTKKTPPVTELVTVVEGEISSRLDIYLDLGKKVFLGDKMIEIGKSVVLENVKFGANSAALTAAAKEDLDKLVKLSGDISTMHIELGGYTDNGGEPETNKKLSEKRVESCKAYLVSKGIDASRIATVGHGQSKPIATNNTPEGRAKNRRVEVKIVKF